MPMFLGPFKTNNHREESTRVLTPGQRVLGVSV